MFIIQRKAFSNKIKYTHFQLSAWLQSDNIHMRSYHTEIISHVQLSVLSILFKNTILFIISPFSLLVLKPQSVMTSEETKMMYYDALWLKKFFRNCFSPVVLQIDYRTIDYSIELTMASPTYVMLNELLWENNISLQHCFC